MLFCSNWLVKEQQEVRYYVGFFYVDILIVVIITNLVVVVWQSIKKYLALRNKNRYFKKWESYCDKHIKQDDEKLINKLIIKHPRNIVILKRFNTL